MKIVAVFPLTDSQRALLMEASGGAEILDASQIPERVSTMDGNAMAAYMADCDVIASYRVPDNLTKVAPRLKWLQLMTAGAERAMADEATRRSAIVISTASGVHVPAMGEYVVMSMLAYAHKFHLSLRAQRRHEWIPLGYFRNRAWTLNGRTLGVLGYGSIGREAARLAQPFGMEILALKRDPNDRRDTGWCPPGRGDPEGRIPRAWFGPEQRMEMLAQCDFVVVTLPLTPATTKFVGAPELAAIKPGAYLINVGRGEVVDQEAMVAALESGRLGGAGLDVVVPEPLDADSPLWDLENVLLTPHMSGLYPEYADNACAIFAENLRRYRAGRASEMVNLVDRTRGY